MKIKTQEVKKSILKSLKSKKDKDVEENKFIIDESGDDDEDEDDASLDSDQELQLAFAKKQLTPGLNVEMDKPKIFVNDEEGLKRKLKDFYLNMEWVERMDVTVPKSEITINGLEATKNADGSSDLVDNDFRREGLFLKQAEAAINACLPKIKNFGIATQRPEDYFAQMAKSDDHMKRVRENLLSKHAEMEKREKVRKLREMKKMGKQIQVEVEKKKQQAKKKLKDSIKKFKKGDKDDLAIELEDDDGSKAIKKRSASRMEDRNENDSKKIKKSGKKADYKEKKYGFGGRKKRSKYNTAESYAEAYLPKKDRKGNNNKFGDRKGGNNKFNGANKFANKKFTNKNKPKGRKK